MNQPIQLFDTASSSTVAMQLQDGDLLRFGAQELRAPSTPGHTAGSMSFDWLDHVFTGDTLLIGGCGRTDFRSASARSLYRSITERLFSLPDTTTVWPGHDYQGRSHSTIGAEKTGNPGWAADRWQNSRRSWTNSTCPNPSGSMRRPPPTRCPACATMPAPPARRRCRPRATQAT